MKNKASFQRTRRDFLRDGSVLIGMAMTLWPGGSLAQAPSAQVKSGPAPADEKPVSPVEDLMQEHAVLSRILLIYEDIRKRLVEKRNVPVEVLAETVKKTRSFVEDYHEKLEEDHIFPRFVRKGTMTDLVKVLLQQHEVGRRVTDHLLRHATPSGAKTNKGRETLARYLNDYIRMYRPHASREGTVLFQAFRSLVPLQEYMELGEKFEELEHARFGDGGFSQIVAEISELEKALNILELSQFTPRI